MTIDPEKIIIHEDDQLLIVNKPAGLVIDSQSEVPCLRSLLSDHYQQQLYITYRIDQVVSGVCLLARSKQSASQLNNLIQNQEMEKSYLAVVSSGVAKEKDHLEASIFHDRKLKKAFINRRKGKNGKLDYEKISASDRYDLLKVKIENGRFHQIRCMLAEKGMPIKGDVKYGFKRSNKGRFIHLHANSLTFKHPYTGRIVSFSAPLPSETLWQFFAKSVEDKTHN